MSELAARAATGPGHGSTYLSIDIDYWFASVLGENPPLNGLFKLLRAVRTKPCVVVEEHHQLLPHLDEVAPTKVLHVDYHTDVAFPVEGRPIELNCGTFFWFMQNRADTTYRWFYPELDCPRELGLCMDASYKPLARQNWIFKEQTRKLGLPTRKELASVTHVGIAISRDYCGDQDRVTRLLRVLKQRYLPHADWHAE